MTATFFFFALRKRIISCFRVTQSKVYHNEWHLNFFNFISYPNISFRKFSGGGPPGTHPPKITPRFAPAPVRSVKFLSTFPPAFEPHLQVFIKPAAPLYFYIYGTVEHAVTQPVTKVGYSSTTTKTWMVNNATV